MLTLFQSEISEALETRAPHFVGAIRNKKVIETLAY